MLPGKELCFLFIGSFLLHFTTAATKKHMYALCPPDFFGIGTECYYISKDKVNWLDAHFDCRDRKSRLAEPIKYEDRMIRKFLINNDPSRESKWIGGNYNWAQKKWQWQDGKEFTYQSFSQMPGKTQDLQYHCAILNPSQNYRWSASSCVEKHQYICQHRMPYVNEQHRSRIYSRWNQTYPNEKASEVEVVVNIADTLKRGNRQSGPLPGRTTNGQRLSRHRNYLAAEWLKKYKTQQIIVSKNQISIDNEVVTQNRNKPLRHNRLKPRRRNPKIERADFLQFERQKNINRGALISNKVEDDFHKQEPVSTVSPTHTTVSPTKAYNRIESPSVSPTSPPTQNEANTDIDLQEQKRLEETKKMLQTGRYESTYNRRKTTTTTSTESNASIGDNERIEMERNRDLENRRREAEEARERQKMEERLQNQINEETLRIEREEEWKNLQLEEENKRKLEEKQRIREQNMRDREEKMRQRELELQQREEEERKLREDEERRQEENRQRLEEINRIQREEEEKQRIEAENKRIEEENRRRKKMELRQRQKMRENQVSESSEEQQLEDARLKEKLRREKVARLRERLSKLSPEDRLKFMELRKRNKKENKTTTNQV